MKKDISTVTNNHLCFSCGACERVCRDNCINFNISNGGRLLPVIDYNKCTNCGVCYKICPGISTEKKVNNLKDLFIGDVLNSYLGKSLDSKVYGNSQSGGMVTEVLSYLFDKNLIKYAAVVKMDYSIYPMPTYFLATSKNDLIKSQKSIYLPINILRVFENIKKVDGDIAIVGVGCQIQGLKELKKYKPKVYEKIKYKLGLICDGVLSYISNDIFTDKKKYKIIYKDKKEPNYIDANVVIEDINKNRKIIDKSIRFFLKDLVTPNRCYICADKMNIYADFVFGDPWGIEGYDKKNGESVVVIRNKKAEKIIQNIIKEKRAILKKISYENILKGQQISNRKEKVLNSLAIYKKYGFEVPKYYEKIELPKKVDKTIEKKILKNAKMEQTSYKFNVISLKLALLYKRVVLKVQSVIKKILKV